MSTSFFIITFCLLLLFIVFDLFYGKKVHNVVQVPPEEPAVLDTQPLEEDHPKLYPLQTHTIKYSIYSPYRLKNYGLKQLYAKAALENLWFNEPFYSSFFKIMLLLDQDELFMIDPYSKIIVSNLRDQNSNMVRIKSYQVLSIQKLVCSVLQQVYADIMKFAKNDAQNVLLAVCIYLIKKSKYFESYSESDLLDLLIEHNENIHTVQNILVLFHAKNEKLSFVESAVTISIKELDREPYVDKGKVLRIAIPANLPKKELQHLE